MICISIDILVSLLLIYMDYEVEARDVGEISLESLNYFEYFILMPLFVGSYIFIYRRLRSYHSAMILRYESLMTEDELKILHRTNLDILFFFMCICQYLIMRVFRVIISLAALDMST